MLQPETSPTPQPETSPVRQPEANPAMQPTGGSATGPLADPTARPTGTRARYEEIAIDLARRIASGELEVGSRLSGRSLLAATYRVSAETVRRGVALLHARGVLEAVAGSGIRVLSKERAVDFLEQKRLGASVLDSERELRDLLRRRAQLDHLINEALRRVMQQTQRLLALAGDIGEVRLTEQAAAVGKSLAEIGLRARTGATALVIVRGEAEHFSPPADFRLQAGDVILVTGEEPARLRAGELLQTGELQPGDELLQAAVEPAPDGHRAVDPQERPAT